MFLCQFFREDSRVLESYLVFCAAAAADCVGYALGIELVAFVVAQLIEERRSYRQVYRLLGESAIVLGRQKDA